MLGLGKLLKEKLAKTKNSFVGKIAEAVKLRGKVDEELLENLEEILIGADIGPELSAEIIDDLRVQVRLKKISDAETVQDELKEIMARRMHEDYEDNIPALDFAKAKPLVVLMVGVNGTGKTTTIGKLALRYKQEGKNVMVIAADTFRAAAVEQLTIWAQRAQVEIWKKEEGADPSAVIYDGLSAARRQNCDLVLIDTAGRQHNRVNLMNELAKITRTIQKVIPEAPHETFLVVDAVTGQNGLAQAKLFNEITPLTGLILTKLDGTAKGGIVLGIKKQLNLPVKYIGVGEKPEHLQDFDAQEYVSALFGRE